MMLNLTDTPAANEYATVYVAVELSKAKWKLGVLLPGRASSRWGKCQCRG
jgi:transposase